MIRFNRGRFDSTLRAARKAAADSRPRYIIATALGYAIGLEPLLSGQDYYEVLPSGEWNRYYFCFHCRNYGFNRLRDGRCVACELLEVPA